jgi:DNA-binding response OmpR family regulator
LVAEDDLEMRRVIVDALTEDGHEVYSVGDGAALLIELARSDRFHYQSVDLVIADVRMPICTGLQALETLRSVGAPFPILLMTAFGDEEMHEQARRLGAPLIDKPFSIGQLRRTIAGVLGARRTG